MPAVATKKKSKVTLQPLGDKVVVERHGEPIAAVVPVHVYEQWKRRREAFFAKMRAVSEQASLSPEEAQRIAAESVQAVRAKQR